MIMAKDSKGKKNPIENKSSFTMKGSSINKTGNKPQVIEGKDLRCK